MLLQEISAEGMGTVGNSSANERKPRVIHASLDGGREGRCDLEHAVLIEPRTVFLVEPLGVFDVPDAQKLEEGLQLHAVRVSSMTKEGANLFERCWCAARCSARPGNPCCSNSCSSLWKCIL